MVYVNSHEYLRSHSLSLKLFLKRSLNLSEIYGHNCSEQHEMGKLVMLKLNSSFAMGY